MALIKQGIPQLAQAIRHWWKSVLLVVIIAGLGYLAAQLDSTERKLQLERRSHALATVLEQHLSLLLRQGQLRLTDVVAQLHKLDEAQIERSVPGVLRQAIRFDPGASTYFVQVGDQLWLMSAANAEVPYSFEQQLKGVLQGRPVQLGRTAYLPLQLLRHGWLLQMQDSMQANGRLFRAGVLLPLSEMDSYLQRLSLDLVMPMALVGENGQAYWSNGPLPALFHTLLARQSSATAMTDNADESGSAVLFQRTLGNFPLRLALLRTEDESLSDLNGNWQLPALAILLAAVVILLLTARLQRSRQNARQRVKSYQQMFESISDGVLLLLDGRVQMANDRAAELFGVASSDDLRGCYFASLAQSAARETCRQLLRDAEVGQELNQSLLFQPLNNTCARRCEIRLSHIQLNRRSYVMVCMNDVSARVQIEENLRESRNQLLEAQRLSRFGVWTLDATKICMVGDEVVSQILGLEPGQVLNDPHRVVASKDLSRVRASFNAVLQGEPLDCEFRIHRLCDGALRYVHFCGELSRTVGEGEQRLFGVVLDITERKQIEQRLIDSERQFRDLVELLPDGLVIHRNWQVLFANPAAARMLGAASTARLQGKNFLQFIDTSSQNEVQRRMRQIHAEPDFVPTFQPRLMRRLDGSELAVEALAQNFNLNGERCVQVVLRDVSEQRRLQTEVQAANQRLQLVSSELIAVQETERRHLARELHDDVGQLLTFIKVSAASISRKLHGDLEQGVLTLADIAAEALSKVRNLSRTLRPAQLDALGLEAAIRWQLQTYMASTELRWSLTSEPLQPRPAAELEIALFRIFQEALTNVLKHAQASHVQVALGREQDLLYLTVRDDGCGFDPAQVLHQGQCLGLLSMGERAKLLGGEVLVNSIPNQGSEVRVQLSEARE